MSYIPVEKKVCPNCFRAVGFTMYERWHGDNCKKAKTAPPEQSPGINKYVELHEKYVDLVGQYHNVHITFMNKPSMWTSRELVTIMMLMGKIVKEIKINNLLMRQQMQIDIKERKKAGIGYKEANKFRKPK